MTLQQDQLRSAPVPAPMPAPVHRPGFFGSRTGWRDLRQHVLLEPVKGGSRWTAVFGSMLLFGFILQVGSSMGNLTLTRFFALHGFILPGAVIALAYVHLYLFRLHGVTPPWWCDEHELLRKQEPFWPGQAWKDAVAAFALLVVLATWSYFRP